MSEKTKLTSGADERTPSHPQYFSWINNGNEGATEEQTLINLEYFRWLHDTYGISDDPINIMYVFRNADGEVVSYCYSDTRWDDMWSKSFGEFNIPQAPDAVGEYTLDIYFNGKLVAVKAVNIVA